LILNIAYFLLSFITSFFQGESQIQRAIEDLCYELNLPTNCILTATPEQLRLDGYHATVVEANVTIAQDYSMLEDLKGLSLLEIPGRTNS
jgi:hypothetical protein